MGGLTITIGMRKHQIFRVPNVTRRDFVTEHTQQYYTVPVQSNSSLLHHLTRVNHNISARIQFKDGTYPDASTIEKTSEESENEPVNPDYKVGLEDFQCNVKAARDWE